MFGLSDGHLQRVASVVDRSLYKYTHTYYCFFSVACFWMFG